MTILFPRRRLRIRRDRHPVAHDGRPAPRPDRAGAPTAPRSGVGIKRNALVTFAVPVALVALAGVAFLLRAALIDQQSAFMDEGTYVLTGRTLIEERAMYARALDWTYGSYLWSLIAGSAHMAGGLRLVRLITAGLGTVMALATALTAFHLAPRAMSRDGRWGVALIAGLIMAVAPTAVALGRFATYDAPAGAAFMCGVAVLVASWRGGRGALLLLAAALLFVAFLAKYVVAIYFPFVCLALLFGPGTRRGFLRNLLWCVGPLSLACVLYFLAFRQEMFNLLAYAASYTDLKSEHPLREYVWQRPEIWLLALCAAAGWPRATRNGRLVGLGGAAVIAGFHALSRADHDWWKHSLYALYFLAPLAALGLLPPATWLARTVLAGFRWGTATGTERLVALAGAVAVIALQARLWPRYELWSPALIAVVLLAPLAGLALLPLLAGTLADRAVHVRGRRRLLVAGLAAGLIMPLPLSLTLAQANVLTTFYPNLNPALAAIKAETAGARTVLTDDSVLRYHLYGRLPADKIADPFYIEYEGIGGMDGYRRSIADRYWDAIVLDGGVGPIGQALRRELGALIPRYYERVYEHHADGGALIEVYRPRADDLEPATGDADALVYTFADGPQGWGAHPADGQQQASAGVALAPERPFRDRASLRFTADEPATLVAVRVDGPVRRVRAQILIADERGDGEPVRIGMVGFDEGWRWRDDGFAQAVPTGRWITVTWDLAEPGFYREIGLKFPGGERHTAYLGSVEVAR